MKARSLFFATLCTGLFSTPVLAQRDFSAVQIEATHVAGSVWMLVGSGGNIGVSSGSDGVLMVDDQFAPLADKIRDALREVGQSEEAAEPQFLLNTHFHGDHTGGNVEFGDASTIVAHTNVRTRLVAGGSPEVALPVVTFDDAVSIHFNGEEIRAFHIPHGHTDGDALIYFTGSNVLHMGDDFFAGRFPFVDIDSGGSVEGLPERDLGRAGQRARRYPHHPRARPALFRGRPADVPPHDHRDDRDGPREDRRRDEQRASPGRGRRRGVGGLGRRVHLDGTLARHRAPQPFRRGGR